MGDSLLGGGKKIWFIIFQKERKGVWIRTSKFWVWTAKTMGRKVLNVTLEKKLGPKEFISRSNYLINLVWIEKQPQSNFHHIFGYNTWLFQTEML